MKYEKDIAAPGKPRQDGNQRSLLLNDETKTKILRALRAGAHLEIAALSAGITTRTLQMWLKKGRDGKEPYASFWNEVQETLAAVEVRIVRDIVNAGKLDPQHLRWWLERKYPERWGKRLQHEVKQDIKFTAEPVRVNKEAAKKIEEVWELISPEEQAALLDQYEINDSE